MSDLRAYYERLNEEAELLRYKSVDLQDFRDEFPTFPEGVNPLDPAIVNPAAFAHIGRMQGGAGAAAGAGGGPRRRPLRGDWAQIEAMLQQVEGIEDNDELLLALQEMLLLDGEGGAGAGAGAGAAGGRALHHRPQLRRGNLDPHMPLMELFLLTIWPWNDIDTTGIPDDDDHV